MDVFREIGQADMIIPYYVTSEGKSFIAGCCLTYM